MNINLFIVFICGDLLKLLSNFGSKSTGLFRETLLHLKQVPVRPDALKHLVEKLVKVLPEGVSNLDDMVSEGYFVLFQVPSNFSLDE